MRRLISIAALVLLFAAVGVPGSSPGALGAEEKFLAGFEDVPLMDGLAVVEGKGMVFDTAAGRLVESYARGAVGRAEVLAFYDSALPQLGWTGTGHGAFQREGERLAIRFLGPDGDLVVHFTLSPTGGAPTLRR